MVSLGILRKGLLAGVAVGALALGGGTVQAASVKSLVQSGPNTSSDDNREYMIDRTFGAAAGGGVTGQGVVGQLDVGDSLRGLFDMNRLNGTPIGAGTANDQWTGVFQTLVVGKTIVPGVGVFYAFAPDPAFEAVYGTGALVAMFTNVAKTVAHDFTDTTAPAAFPCDDGTTTFGACPTGAEAVVPGTPPSSEDVSIGPYATEEAFIATATTGPHFWTLGFSGPAVAAGVVDPTGALATLGIGPITSPSGGAGEGWTAITTAGLGDNLLAAFGFSTGTTGALFNAGVTCLVSGIFNCADVNQLTASPFGVGLTEVAFTGTVRGISDLSTPFEASSNIDAAFNLTFNVPEPASLGIIGAGLLGLGLARSRRRRSV